MKSPCATCERKGCGAYHDQCEEYQKYHEAKMKQAKETQQKERRPYAAYNARVSATPQALRHRRR